MTMGKDIDKRPGGRGRGGAGAGAGRGYEPATEYFNVGGGTVTPGGGSNE